MTRTTRFRKGSGLACTCWFTALLQGAIAAAYGESAVPPAPSDPTTPESPILPGNPGEYTDDGWSAHPLQYGPVDVHMGLSGGGLFDDNIYTTESDEESDFILSLSPTIALSMGDYRQRQGNLLSVDYTPSFVFYTDNSDLNAVNHRVNAAGQWKREPWQLNLSQGYLDLFDSSSDIGGLTRRQIFNTMFSGQYEISPKTALEANFRQNLNNYDSETGSTSNDQINDWTVESFVNYQATPKFKASVGLAAGWVDSSESVDTCFQQLLTRVMYKWSEKLDFTASVGAQLQEFEEFQNMTQDNKLNGIFALGTTYRPVEKTVLGLGAYRRDNTSASSVNENYTVTGVDLSIRQFLTPTLSAGLSGGYSYSDYYSTAKGFNSDRADDYWRVQVSLDWKVMEKLTVGVFYQHRQDDSSGASASLYSYENNQAGFTCSYRF